MKPLSAADQRVAFKDGVNANLAMRVLEVVDKGLVHGIGKKIPGQMCVEAAVAYAYGEDHNDHPECVDSELAGLKIELNDGGEWDDDKDRARGLRRLAIAQLGSKGRFDIDKFWDLMNDFDPPMAAAKQAMEALKKEIDGSIRHLSKFSTCEDVRDLLADIMGSAESKIDDFETPDRMEDINEWMFRINNHHDLAEKMVQCLIKMKIPGTKFLYLTEKKKRAKKPVKKTKTKAKKKKTAK